MRKSIKVTVIALTAAILTGGTLYMCRPKENTEVPDNAITESIPTDVKVDIRKTQEDIPEYREITDEETGETVIAEVQKNDPPETKPTTPPEYKKEQTVVEKKVETNSETNKKQTSEKGKVYVDGFGYVDKAGETKTQTGVSDGDINKMVGSMD